jgi:DNA relaxase NicK
VGKRKNGKLLRVYEKGKQLGDESSPWVRWELELHNRDRVIPWEVLLEPVQDFKLRICYKFLTRITNELSERHHS